MTHKHEFISKRNKSLAENKIKKIRLNNYYPNISMNRTYINTKNSKTNEPHKFVINLSQRLDLRSSNKHVALQKVPIYYTWKNIRKQCKVNKLKVPSWIDIFESSKTLTRIPLIHVYIKKITD